jgi:mercuric reductase
MDIVIIGGGAAGLAAAEGAVAAGAKRITLIERGQLGGDCPNEACIPTKTLLASARLYNLVARDGQRLGLKTGRLQADWAAILRRKEAVVQAITGGGRKYEAMLRGLGVEYVPGTARLVNAHTVQVGKRLIETKAIVVATGAREHLPDIAGLQDIPWLTYREVLKLKKLPKSALILGGGAVAVELATLLASLDVPVTIIEQAKHILSREDEELATLIQAELQRLGVAIHVGAQPLGLERTKNGITCTWQRGLRPRHKTEASICIVATGRVPNYEALDLESAGIKLDHQGLPLKVSAKLNLAKNIFVAGDANLQPQFTATAHHAGWLAGWNAAHVGQAKKQQSVDWSIVPRVIFSAPEFASVGYSTSAAIAAGHKITLKRAPFSVLARAITDGSSTGFAKLVLDQKNNLILGAHIFGPHAGEIIHEVTLAMRHGLTYTDLTTGLRAFPSYGEILAFTE